MNKKLLLAIILGVYVCVLIAGLVSQVYLGDEVYHYRFAKDNFKLGKRAIFDSVFESGNPPGYFYNTSPLWPYLLAGTWKVFDRVSFPVAQIYHSLFFILLILFTYLLARDLYDKKRAFYSIIILISMPMVVVFSIIFYNDIPGVAMSMFSLLLFFRKKIFLSGLILGLAYLTKNNSLFLALGMILLIILYYKDNFFNKLKNTIIFLAPIIFIFLQDTNWKVKHIEMAMGGIDIPVTSSSISNEIKIIDKNIPSEIKKGADLPNQSIRKTQLTDTKKVLLKGVKHRISNVIFRNLNFDKEKNKDIIKYIIQYLGIIFLLLIFLYFVFIKRNFKADIALLILIFSYIGVSFCFLDIKDLRYWFPIIPLFSIIISRIFANYPKKYFTIIILVVCIVQFFASLIYININRRIPKGITEGFNYIKNNTPENSLIMYPGYILLEETSRRFVWSQLKCNDLLPISTIFWPKDSKEFLKMIKLNNINYFAIPKFRIYDDAKTHHYNGYPKSFVERLSETSFVKLVFENKQISIWKVIY